MAKLGGSADPKETPAAKRAAAARAAAIATSDAPARRGEEDEPPRLRVAEPIVVPQQASAATVVEPGVAVVTLGSEAVNPLRYEEIPPDVSDLEWIAFAQRKIITANRAVDRALGLVAKNYVLSAGRYLWEASKNGKYKAAGHKSIDGFAASLDMDRRDVYRLRDAYPVYAAIGDLVEEPLNERTIRELAIAVRQSVESCRLVFAEMKRSGRISSAGAIAARRLLAAGDPSEIIAHEPQSLEAPPAVDRLNKARKDGRLVDVAVLKEAHEADPKTAQMYVDELRAKYEEARSAIG